MDGRLLLAAVQRRVLLVLRSIYPQYLLKCLPPHGLYYVYLIRWRQHPTNTLVLHGRHLLTFEPRYAADELFRILQGMVRGGNPRFTYVAQKGPQL